VGEREREVQPEDEEETVLVPVAEAQGVELSEAEGQRELENVGDGVELTDPLRVPLVETVLEVLVEKVMLPQEDCDMESVTELLGDATLRDWVREMVREGDMLSVGVQDRVAELEGVTDRERVTVAETEGQWEVVGEEEVVGHWLCERVSLVVTDAEGEKEQQVKVPLGLCVVLSVKEMLSDRLGDCVGLTVCKGDRDTERVAEGESLEACSRRRRGAPAASRWAGARPPRPAPANSGASPATTSNRATRAEAPPQVAPVEADRCRSSADPLPPLSSVYV